MFGFGKRNAQTQRLETLIGKLREPAPALPELYTDGAGELCTRTGSRPAYAFDSFGSITGRTLDQQMTDADRASVAALIERINADAARAQDAA